MPMSVTSAAIYCSHTGKCIALKNSRGGILFELTLVVTVFALFIPLLLETSQKFNNHGWLSQLSYLTGYAGGEATATERSSRIRNLSQRLVQVNNMLRRLNIKEASNNVTLTDSFNTPENSTFFQQTYIQQSLNGSFKTVWKNESRPLAAPLQGPVLASSPGIVASYDTPKNAKASISLYSSYPVYFDCCGDGSFTPQTVDCFTCTSNTNCTATKICEEP